jgi:uncharacterized membrane protein YfcA
MRLVLIGLAAGFLGALFGVGGGIVIVPALVLFCGFETRTAAATSLTAVLVTAAVGSLTYAFHGDVKPGAAAIVGIPAMIGVVAGTALQQRIPVRQLTYAFAALLVVVAVRLLV